MNWDSFFFLYFEGENYRELPWGALDDVVMGGVSESTFQIDPNGGESGGPTGLFKGSCKIHCIVSMQENDVLFLYMDLICHLQVLFQLQTTVVLQVSGQR